MSCDDPELDKLCEEQERIKREQEDRDKRVWEAGVSSGEKIQGRRVTRTEYRAHEADIKVDIIKRIVKRIKHYLGKTSEQETEGGSCQDEDDRDK